MDISPEIIYAVVAGLAGAVAYQNRQAAANHKKCEERSDSLEERVTDLSQRQEALLVGVITENTESNRAVVDYLRKLRDSVKDGISPDSDSELLPSVRDGYERRVLERREDGTTVILRRRV